MSTSENNTANPAPMIVLLDADVVARQAVASYLRECGYDVVEAATDDDAKKFLDSGKYAVDILICATRDIGSADAFSFSRWIRAQHPGIRVLLAATIEKTAKLASDICQEGPHLRKPYDHAALLEWIKRLRR